MWRNAYCEFYKDYKDCELQYMVCLGEKQKENLLKDNKESWDVIQEKLENSLEGFSWKANCTIDEN